MSTANTIGSGHNPGTDDDEDWEVRTGLEAYEDKAHEASFSMPDFFYLKEGADTKIIYVDREFEKDLHSFDLHSWFTNDGKNGRPRKHMEPCLSMRYNAKSLAEQGFRVAPCCKIHGPINNSMDRNLGVQTIIDGTEFTDKNGNKRKYEMRIFPINKGTAKTLTALSKDWGRLSGWVVKVRRTGEKTPRVGGSFERDIDKTTGTVVSKEYDSLFKVVMFRGKLLSKLWEDAENEIAERAQKIAEMTESIKTATPGDAAELNRQILRLQEPGDWTRYVLHYFRVKLDGGKIVAVDREGRAMGKGRVVPVFNYKKIFKPRPPEEYQRLYAHMDASTGDTPVVATGVASSGRTAPSSASDDVLPF